MIGQNAVILVFWILSFKPAFSLSSFIFIKKFFSSSSLSVIRVVSFAYLRLLIFLQEILIPARDSSSPAFHMMYSAYNLINQGDNISAQFTCLVVSDSLRLLENCSTPGSGFLVHHQLPELTQTHVHQVGDAIQPSHPLPSPSPPAFNKS